MSEEKSKKGLSLKRFLPLMIIISLMIAAFMLGLHEKFSLEALQENKESLLSMVENNSVLYAFGFMGLYALSVALSLPIATPLTLAGGFLFGKWLGTLYVVIAATIGAVIVFIVAQTSLGTTLREKAGGLYKRIESNMKDNAVGYLLFMRLVPIFPFFLVNIAPALFNVPLRTFALTTFFGIIPGSFVYVNLGEQLGEIENLSDLVSMQTLLAFGLLGIFALIPTLYKQLKKKKALFILMFALTFSAATAQADAYKGLLETHIHPSQKNGISYNGVDYDNWAKDERHALAMAKITKNNIAALKSQNERMAFWINAYNLLTIDLIIQKNEKETIKNLGSFFVSPWKKYKWNINGQPHTLDQIEHEILRPMGDARIHFAINCASVSCPDLRSEPYKAETLDKQLNEQVKLTLSSTGKGVVKIGLTVKVSKIFDWFSEDFNNGNISQWLKPYVSISPDTKIKFLDYDWSLNARTKQ